MRTRYLLASTIGCLSVLSGAKAQSVDYGMLEQLFGEPVTTSAIGSPQKATDAPANIQIITADDIRRSGATNLPDILRYYAGIDVRGEGIGGGEVSIRGYSHSFNNRLLVLVNGRQVYVDDNGYVAWQSIPVQLDEIRQIEIVKGPASALYGFNAVSGVINILTYDPRSDSTNVATVRGGTSAFGGGDAVTTIHVGDAFGLRLSVGGYHADEFPAPNLTNPVEEGPYQLSFAADMRYKPTSDSEITLEGTRSLASNSMIVGEGGGTYGTEYRTDSVKVGYALDSTLGLINVDAYRNEVRNTVNVTPAIDIDLIEIDYIVQANDVFKIGTDHTVRVGVEYRNNYGAGGSYNDSIGYSNYAGSVMWNWQISPQWSLTNAGRVDYLTLSRSSPSLAGLPFSQSDYNHATITAPSYNSGLVYKPSDDDTFRLLLSRGIGAPTLIDFGFQAFIPTGPHSAFAVVGNPDLSPTAVTNYEIDYDRGLPLLHSTLRTAIFDQKNRALIADPTSAGTLLLPGNIAADEARNIGDSSAFGGEIGLYGSDPSGWRWSVAYSFVRITDQLTVPTGGTPAATPWDFAHGTPSSSVDLGLGYSWGKFETDVKAKWQSSFIDYVGLGAAGATTGYQPILIKQYVTADARIGYRLTNHVEVALTGAQINQSVISQSAGVPVDRRGIASLTVRY